MGVLLLDDADAVLSVPLIPEPLTGASEVVALGVGVATFVGVPEPVREGVGAPLADDVGVSERVRDGGGVPVDERASPLAV